MHTVLSVIIAAVILVAIAFVGLLVIGAARGWGRSGSPAKAFTKGYREGKAGASDDDR